VFDTSRTKHRANLRLSDDSDRTCRYCAHFLCTTYMINKNEGKCFRHNDDTREDFTCDDFSLPESNAPERD